MTNMDFETQIYTLARQIQYPRTPNIARHLLPRLQPATSPRRPRPLAWSLTVILILLFSLFLIPPARAAILEFIQIGIVRIFPRAVTPTPVSPQTDPATATPVTPASEQTPASLIPLLTRFLGQTTLTDAVQRVSFPIYLPTHPADLGLPDYVFVQDVNGDMVILVWLDPSDPSRVRLSLHFISNESWVIRKYQPEVIQETTVNGQPAIWTVGPYPVLSSYGNVEFTRLVEGHVLIWVEGAVTHRLETDLSLDETRKVAESLEPFP